MTSITASPPDLAHAVGAGTRSWLDAGRGAMRFVAAYAIALLAFGFIVLINGKNPVSAVVDMTRATLDARSIGEVLTRSGTYILAALAVAVPARAGLVNVGGEGQIVIGAVAAAGIAREFDGRGGGFVVIAAMLLGAALAAAAWSGLAAAARVGLRIPEAITTLLLNYIAIDVMLYLIYDKWKDPKGTGQPTSAPLAENAHLPVLSAGGGKTHFGIVIALVAAGALFFVLRKSAWGFTLRAVGGNANAARRAGLPVGRLIFSAMLVGGALAGVAGMVHFSGSEFKLRTGMTAGFGYTAFLASWLGRHRPLPIVAGSLLLAFLAVGGSSLQLDAGLPAATVNVLMAFVLLSVLATSAPKRRTA